MWRFQSPDRPIVSHAQTLDGWYEPLGFLRKYRADTDPACVINEFVRDREFPDEDPVGKLLYAANTPRTIVGVVENTIVYDQVTRPMIFLSAIHPIIS